MVGEEKWTRDICKSTKLGLALLSRDMDCLSLTCPRQKLINHSSMDAEDTTLESHLYSDRAVMDLVPRCRVFLENQMTEKLQFQSALVL